MITPIDGSVIARVAAGGAEEADLAVRAAHAAAPGWAALGAPVAPSCCTGWPT